MTRGQAFTILILTGAIVSGSACAPSSDELKSQVESKPGVLRVHVEEAEGDDAFPLEHVAKTVDVVMKAEATGDQVRAVVDAYEPDIRAGDVDYLSVSFESRSKVRLTAGAGGDVTAPMIQELLGAARDQTIIEYARRTYDTPPAIFVKLEPIAYPRVLARVAGYGAADATATVVVESGDFRVTRGAAFDPARWASRARFTLAMNRRFELSGAVFAAKGPIRLSVGRADIHKARKYAMRLSDDGVIGPIILVSASKARL